MRKYGNSYRSIQLSWDGGVKDLSPLSDLEQLEHVTLFAQRCDRLWDMSRNTGLRILIIDSCRQLTANPCMLRSAPGLETIWYLGGAESVHSMASLNGFANLPALQELRLQSIRLQDRDLGFLATVPRLATFDFEAHMFTTEKIAWMAANYPNLGGEFLRAYGPAYPGASSWVRVSGSRKPELKLPDDQQKLDRYIRGFEELKRRYLQQKNA